MQSVAKIRALCGERWANANVQSLAADASDRKFYRVTTPTQSIVFIDSSLERRKIVSYIEISQHLLNHGFSAPKVFDFDVEAGYLVVEDLGAVTMGKKAGSDADRRFTACRSVVDILPMVQRIPENGVVPKFSTEHLLNEVKLFTDWYWHSVEDVSDAKTQFLGAFRVLIEQVIKGPPVFVHKDLHLDNLTWLADRERKARLGLLDFQDAKYGPAHYDLVSLLEDPRYPLRMDDRKCLIRMYLDNAAHISVRDFERDYAVLTALRCMKILGNIAFLVSVKGKHHYLQLEAAAQISVLRSLEHPELREIRKLVKENGAFPGS